MRIHLARMHSAAAADEFQHRCSLRRASRRPNGARRARVHQFVKRPRQIAIVDEEILLHRQFRIASLEVTGTIVRDPMAQREILRPCRRANRIGLHESQLVDGLAKRGGLEQGTRYGVTAQMIQRERHAAMIF